MNLLRTTNTTHNQFFIPNCPQLAQAVLPSVAVVNYDFQNTGPGELLRHCQSLLGGRPPVSSMAVAAPGFGPARIGLVRSAATTEEELKVRCFLNVTRYVL